MLKKQTFSKPQLAVFVIVFALLGTVIIWRSFASTSVSLPTIYYESEPYTGDGGSASNCYQSTWAMGKSPTTPYISPDSYHHAQRYLLVNPNANDGNGHQGKDDWWFAFEHYVDTSTPLTFAGQDDSFFNLHNVAGDSGPNGGIGWGFGDGVSAFHLLYNGSTGLPYMLLENNASGGSHYDLPALSKGQWHQFVIHITFGRTDGTTPRPGAVQLWVDGTKRYDLGNLNILQKAVGPDGKTYVQQWVQLWQGTYIKGAPCNPSNTSPRSGQLVLARIGNTFQQALDDIPTFDSFTGTTHIAGYPDFGNSFSRLASTQRTTADFNIPTDLGGSNQTSALPGDLNNNNAVDIQDLSILLSNYSTANTKADINSDGTVNVLDLSILLSHYGQTGVLQKPSAPTGLSVTPGYESVSLKWNANPAAEQVDNYQVYLNDANYNLNISGASFTVTGLTNGTSYSFRVSAHNSAGYGPWTDPAISATP